MCAATLAPSARRASAQDAEPTKIVIAFPPGGTSTASLQPLRGPENWVVLEQLRQAAADADLRRSLRQSWVRNRAYPLAAVACGRRSTTDPASQSWSVCRFLVKGWLTKPRP